MQSMGTAILAIRHDIHLRGVGGTISQKPQIETYQIAATISGNNLTMVDCAAVMHNANNSHGAYADKIVTSIIGLL